MEVKKNDWVTAAMADDTVVVELLLRLKHHSHASSSSSSAMKYNAPPLMFVGWGIRRPRSRSSIRCEGGAYGGVKREKTTGSGESTRFSPTTPLSWSGGSSPTAATVTAADCGFEESSRPSSSFSPPSASRSKNTIITNEISSNKRPRRKQTFAELKEAESLLLTERVHLTEKITTLRETVKEQNVRNVNFKRFKHDLTLHREKNFSVISEAKTISSQQYQREFPLYNRAASAMHNNDLQVDFPKKQKDDASSQDSGFVLPDLNMMPSEDDPHTNLQGTS